MFQTSHTTSILSHPTIPIHRISAIPPRFHPSRTRLFHRAHTPQYHNLISTHPTKAQCHHLPDSTQLPYSTLSTPIYTSTPRLHQVVTPAPLNPSTPLSYMLHPAETCPWHLHNPTYNHLYKIRLVHKSRYYDTTTLHMHDYY